MKARLLVSSIFMTAALLAAQTAFAQDNAAIDKGMKVYADQKCSLCHSIDGKGNVKGPLDGVGTKYSAEDIRKWIVTPKVMTDQLKATRTPAMKAFDKLDKADLDALVAYMFSLKKK